MNYISRVGIEFKTVGTLYGSLHGKSDTELSYIILQAVLEVTEVGLADIKSKVRNKEIRQARQFIHFFARKFTKLSSSGIGNLTINDHSTVLHSVRVVEQDIIADSDIRNTYYKIKKIIESKVKD